MNIEKISTVCIPTCNRPELLKLALNGLIANLKTYNRNPRILIIDDSEKPENAELSKKIADSFKKEYSGIIECIDRKDREEIAQKLSEEKNIPLEVTTFMLLGDKRSGITLGGSHNTFLLKTRGEKILIADDDITYHFYKPLKLEPSFFTNENSLEVSLIITNDQPNFITTIDADFISIHESNLGHKTGEILTTYCPEYIKETEIIDTYMGVYGDSTMESHIPVFLLPHIIDELKKINISEYREMKQTNRIVKYPPGLMLYQGPIAISMVMGIDNKKIVPPFLPLGRGHDLVFGTTRNKAFPLAISAYIPFLVGHERPHKEIRIQAFNAVREFTKMCRIIASIIDECDCDDIDPNKNLEKIGNKILSISEEPDILFKIFIEAQCKKVCKTLSVHINNLIQTNPDMPDFWIEDMEALTAELNSPNSESFLQDITKDNSLDKFSVLKKWLTLYGQILKNWHKLYS